MHFIVADDHALVREALLPFIQKVEPLAQILQAATFTEAMALAERVSDDLRLLILDYKMPGMNGLAALEAVRTLFPKVKIVVLSGLATRNEALALLKNGADGFIPKSLNGEAMVNALRLVLSGEQYFPSMLFETPIETGPAAPRNSLGELGAAISPQERDVLELLVQGLSNKEIALRLNFQEVTIKKRLSSAYRKLGVSSRLQAVQVINAGKKDGE